MAVPQDEPAGLSSYLSGPYHHEKKEHSGGTNHTGDGKVFWKNSTMQQAICPGEIYPGMSSKVSLWKNST
jgi:hypothetical protein